ncbi:cyclic nucleotide-binding domain-containing protein [Terriglobus albidus]|uniref:histidine kinase n=1 Tax=Terriglobus albidus TaxID=1592106 RepID=A0A5B9ECR1_9BACT|nr:ATP-binding protein [Terriglobus albidus]QEE27856.1 cyclic nucleotide-binding domain-containing protein [Terriglobus albidus]
MMIDLTQTVSLTPAEVTERLRALPVFSTLSEEELNCISSAPVVHVPAGQILAQQGEKLTLFGILLQGAVRGYYNYGTKQAQTISTLEAGAVMGEYALITQQAIPVTAEAVEDCLILSYAAEEFWGLMARCPAMRNFILGQLNERLRGAQHRSIQEEKLAALGTLTAGLMHELNNPGAAASRAASQLRSNLRLMHELGKAFSKEHDKREFECVWALQERAFSSERPQCMSSLEEADAEEALAEWLESNNVSNSWGLAPILTSIGITTHDLDCLKAEAIEDGKHSVENIIAWLASMVSSMQLVGTIEESITRITGLVKAVKTYTYEGKSGQSIDLNESVHATLILLKHKIYEKQLSIKKSFAGGLPPLSVHAAGLNQIWTNLLDNAIDAAPSQGGEITVKTGTNGGRIFVTIGDNGAGIAPEDQGKIFETFFTTKPMGVGTGLGLGIAQRIAEQAGGAISFFSEPGKTEFTVSFPIKQESK